MGQGWRSQPLPEDWPRLRALVMARDGGRCTSCGARAEQVDHIRPAYLGGTDHPTNLTALCVPCHRSKTGREARAAQGFRKRPPEPHPGLLG